MQTCIIAQLMPLPPTVSCFSKIQIGFTILVLAHLGSPGQRAVKRVCVCVSEGNFPTHKPRYVCVCVQENKRSDLGEQLQRAKHSVTTYTSAIEHMKAQRDATLTDIDHCQLGLDVCSAAVTLLLNIV